MICAKNKEALSYLGIHPNLDRALESIKPDFLESLQDGVRVELDQQKILFFPEAAEKKRTRRKKSDSAE